MKHLITINNVLDNPDTQDYTSIEQFSFNNDTTSLGIYLAILFFQNKVMLNNFPIPRNLLYQRYCEYCSTLPDAVPLKSNTFSMITNVYYILKGYSVVTVKYPGKRHFAELRRIDPENKYALMTTKNHNKR